ncbi:MAG: hypothetical protein J6Y78_15545 [Paludibacteraceae bacterium]|nr:hypothetical protein [Paludibacteraceae bacterium]
MEIMNEIPKTVFDKEYSTQWRREVKFLEDKGINYTYAKKHYKYPIIRYKYTKTPELFLALVEFYNQVRNEKVFKEIENVSKEVTPLEKGCIDIPVNELSDAEKKTVDFQINEQDVLNVVDDTE